MITRPVSNFLAQGVPSLYYCCFGCCTYIDGSAFRDMETSCHARAFKVSLAFFDCPRSNTTSWFIAYGC